MSILSYIGVVLFIIFFFVSLYANYFLLRRLLFFSENIDAPLQTIDSFTKHLEQLHELHMYYGDENLKDLITHSREVKLDLIEFKNGYDNAAAEKKEKI